MKKLFALMLALCLMLCSAAVAEEATLAGEMFAMDVLGLQMFIPAEYVVDENATVPEMAQLLYAWKASDESGEFLKVSASKIEGLEELDTFLAYAQENVSPEARIIEVESGLHMVEFFNDSDATINAVLIDTNNNIICFEMGPTTDQKEAAELAFLVLMNTLAPIQ
jgi:hypothetical protein